mgnify:CR=1 FL=1
MLTMTALYTGLSALPLVVLSLLVVRERGRARVSLGDGGDAQLQKAIRAQGNFVEYTPLALLVIHSVQLLELLMDGRIGRLSSVRGATRGVPNACDDCVTCRLKGRT